MCPYPCAWKPSAVPTSHTLIGKYHVLVGHWARPEQLQMVENRVSPGKVSAFIWRQETPGKVSGKETLAPPEREERFPYVPNPLQCTSRLKCFFVWFSPLPSIIEVLMSPPYRRGGCWERWGELLKVTADSGHQVPWPWSPYQSVPTLLASQLALSSLFS